MATLERKRAAEMGMAAGAGTLDAVSVHDLVVAAEGLRAAGNLPDSRDLYKGWIDAHPSDPLLYAATFNLSIALRDAGDTAAALAMMRETIRLNPNFYPVHISLGVLLDGTGEPGLAVAQWLEVVTPLAAVNGEAVGHKITALEQIGRVLETLERDESAEDALRQRLELGLDDKVVQHWIGLRMRQCKWPVLDGNERFNPRDLLAGISPLSLAALIDDPLLQLATAAHYNKALIGIQPDVRRWPAAPSGRGMGSTRRRIGYVSSDLREHAVGFSMAEIFELHDRRNVEVYAYYCGIERDDATKQRIRGAVDHWCDLQGFTDEQAAARIEADGIDILVDLNGYTKDARTKVFAMRPAPIAVNWFGFPSTMGSPYHHYLIADAQIVPEGSELFYSETVLRLPCYQPNDRHRTVAARVPSRSEEGLPEAAVVYCCLNGLQKLTAATFGSWMSILAQVPDGVLWLLAGGAETKDRLRQAAQAQGVAGHRLIFADKKANPDHVARFALADLFLDNAPYGAHTTAADALWMGVPVLTSPGRSFASRVCSSLVAAAGLPDMICPSNEAYVAKAVELGTHPERLRALRLRLRENRDSCLLFDSPLLTENLERLYARMWQDCQSGNLPKPDLRNLEIYRDVGVALHAEAIGHPGHAVDYAPRLREWDGTYPIAPDRRLWTGQ